MRKRSKFLLFLLVALPIVFVWWLNRPPRELPVFPECPPEPNCVSTGATTDQHGLKVLQAHHDANASAAKKVEAVLRTLENFHSAVSKVNVDKSVMITANFKSKMLGFIDVVELLVHPDGRVEARSASLQGYSDLGVNRARMDALRDALKVAQ